MVTACADGRGQDQLVAYLVANAALAPPAETLRARLRQVLPAPVSVHLEILDALPRTASGKLDRAALPPLTRTRPLLATPFQAPASDLEVEVARIFGQTLELDEIGLNDSFAELGGKSLGAMRVLTQLSDRYGLRLGLAEFFGAPTVAEIANLVVLHLTYCVSPGLLDEMVTEAERFSGQEAGAILEKKIL